MKRVFFTVLFLIVIGLTFSYGSKLYHLTMGSTDEAQRWDEFCAFCNDEVVQSQKIYENDWAVALLSHKPISEGHVLVLPKRHVERYELLLEEELLHMNQLIKQVHGFSQKRHDSFSYLLLQKNGREAGQTVPHVHFHYIPQKMDEKPFWTLLSFLVDPIMQPMSRDQVYENALSYRQDILEYTKSNSDDLVQQ